MWAMSSIFALVGPPIVGQLVSSYHVEAVAYWTGVNLVVAGGWILGAIWLKRQKENNERRKPSLQSMRTIESVA